MFDRRVSTRGAGAGARVVVGRCAGCGAPHERYDPRVVCVVRKELVLACDACLSRADGAAARRQPHCAEHAALAASFFGVLEPFDAAELEAQAAALAALIARGGFAEIEERQAFLLEERILGDRN